MSSLESADNTSEHPDPVSPVLREFCQECGDDDVVIFHGYDAAVIGLANQFNSGPILVYDQDKVIEILMEEGLSEEDALDHFYFNVAGSYVGERTPIFVTHRFDPSLLTPPTDPT